MSIAGRVVALCRGLPSRASSRSSRAAVALAGLATVPIAFATAFAAEAEEVDTLPNVKIFSGNGNPQLAADIAQHMGKELSQIKVGRFNDGEVSINITDDVAGSDVVLIQPTCFPVNENLIELLLMISAFRRASAARVTAVIPYYGYKRDVGTPAFSSSLAKLRKSKRRTISIPISAADVAIMLESMGVDQVLTVDVQPTGRGQSQGFFSNAVVVDNLEATYVGVEYLRSVLGPDVVVTAPNEASVLKARDFVTGLDGTLTAQGEPRRATIATFLSARASRGGERYFVKRKDYRALELVGEVEGRDVLIVDDLIDTGRSLLSRMEMAKEAGARRVFAYATHGLLNKGAIARLQESCAEEVIVTDTVPFKPAASANTDVISVTATAPAATVTSTSPTAAAGTTVPAAPIADSKNILRAPAGGSELVRARCGKFVQLTVAPLLADAIRRHHTGQSLDRYVAYSEENRQPMLTSDDTN